MLLVISVIIVFFLLQLSSVQTQMHSKGGYSGEPAQGTPGGLDVRNSQVCTRVRATHGGVV